MHNSIQSIILSVVIGIIIGIIYGLSFLIQRKKALSIYESIDLKRFYLTTIILNIIRIVCLFLLFYFIFPSKSINFIIVMLSFIVTFWITILKKEMII